MTGREAESGGGKPESGSGGPSGVGKRRRSGGRGGWRGRDRRAGRGGRGRGRRDHPGPKTKEQLDLEMDLFAAERDGGDVEEVKAAYRKKKEEKQKLVLDSQMDSYFEEKGEDPGVGDANGKSSATEAANSSSKPQTDIAAKAAPASTGGLANATES